MAKFITSAFADEIDADLTVQMDVLEKHNIGFIEMRGVNGKPLVEHTIEEVREIKKQLDQRNFKISAIGSPIGKIKITDDFWLHLELFMHTLDIAEILETKYIRMFSFFIPMGENDDDFRNEVMDRMKKLVNIAEKRNIVLLHENEKDIYGDTPERCLDLFRTINSANLRATFDPANFVQCNIESYPKAYEMMREYIEYIHIKDAKIGERDNVPAGIGDGKIKEILADVKNREGEIFISLEPHLTVFEGFAKLEQNIEKSTEVKNDGTEKFGVAVAALNKILCEI